MIDNIISTLAALPNLGQLRQACTKAFLDKTIPYEDKVRLFDYLILMEFEVESGWVLHTKEFATEFGREICWYDSLYTERGSIVKWQTVLEAIYDGLLESFSDNNELMIDLLKKDFINQGCTSFCYDW